MNDFELMLEKCEAAIKKEYAVLPAFWLSIKSMATATRVLYDFPKMEKVESSNVDRIGYDSTNKIAYVLFLNRSMYGYMDVPEEAFESLKNADSVGSHFCRNFRSKYESKKCIKVGMMGILMQ